jgi:hypothetical protein
MITTRRRAIELIGIGIGVPLMHGVGSAPVLAQTRVRVSIGTAGKAGFFIR